MKKNGLLKNVFVLGLALFIGLLWTGCKKDDKTPAPTVNVVINSVDGFVVDIAAEATDATSWSWDYGDGNVSTTEGGHFYTYSERGDFTITCTVTGEGGSATESVDVHIATKTELLSANTWVLSETGANGMGFHITTDLVLDFPVGDLLATLNSLQSAEDVPYDFTNEYNDEYNFNSDGSYSVNYVNNNVLSSWVYSLVEQGNANVVGTCNFVGMFAVSYAAITDATWTLHENENLTLNTVYDASQVGNTGGVAETVEFVGVDYITFTNGGFLGIKDFTSTVLLKSISEDELVITAFFHSYFGFEDPINPTLGIAEPSFITTMTFKPKM